MKKNIFWLVIILFLIVLCTAISYFFVYSKPEPTNEISTKTAEDQNLIDDQLKKEIGQMIMTGFRGTEVSENSDVCKMIKDVEIGGVTLFDYDNPSQSFPRNIKNYGQVKKLISDTQKCSSIPLLIAVDAEGGKVNRLKPEYGFLSVDSAEKMGEDKTLQTTYKESTDLALELKVLGFNMDFAPVVDVDINHKNPIIGSLGRSFSSNPDEVSKYAEIFTENLQLNDIIAVAKHFPGQGSATEDSHLAATDITETYKQEELAPYKYLKDKGLLKAVMAAHVINKNIDKIYPASMSSAFLQDVLRNQVGFNGVIISDDMQMDAIAKNYKFDEAIISAVNAGVDIITVLNNNSNGYDPNLAYKTRDVIFNAVKDGKIPQQRIDESYNRIINLKKEFNLIYSPENKASIQSQKFELIGQENALTFLQALEMANNTAKYVAIRPAFLMAIFQTELKLEKFDMCYLTDFKNGTGVRAVDGIKIKNVMKPDRDIAAFLKITKELKKDASKTLVTCPMNFGYGGAMGPADFIPSTWMKYKNKIEKITGKPADPWNVQDAFLAAGAYLSDSGANLKTKQGEWDAAMIYFSGSTSSPYRWYADNAIMQAETLQKNIDLAEK